MLEMTNSTRYKSNKNAKIYHRKLLGDYLTIPTKEGLTSQVTIGTERHLLTLHQISRSKYTHHGQKNFFKR